VAHTARAVAEVGLKSASMPKSIIFKRSIVFNGKKTSVNLEDAFWNALKEIAGKRAIRLSDLVAEIDERRGHGNLSSAVRLFVLDYYQTLRKNAE
jgi:predicted DNA-binding ribbon-helix-helix protein